MGPWNQHDAFRCLREVWGQEGTVSGPLLVPRTPSRLQGVLAPEFSFLPYFHINQKPMCFLLHLGPRPRLRAQRLSWPSGPPLCQHCPVQLGPPSLLGGKQTRCDAHRTCRVCVLLWACGWALGPRCPDSSAHRPAAWPGPRDNLPRCLFCGLRTCPGPSWNWGPAEASPTPGFSAIPLSPGAGARRMFMPGRRPLGGCLCVCVCLILMLSTNFYIPIFYLLLDAVI